MRDFMVRLEVTSMQTDVLESDLLSETVVLMLSMRDQVITAVNT